VLQSMGSQRVRHDQQLNNNNNYCIHLIYISLCMHAKSLQLCPTLFDPMDCSLPGFSVHGILQASILECVAMTSSRDLPHPGMEPTSLTSLHWQAGSLPVVPAGKHQSLYHLFIDQSIIYRSISIYLSAHHSILYLNS